MYLINLNITKYIFYIILICTLISCSDDEPQFTPSIVKNKKVKQKDSVDYNHANVYRIIDGDTFELENGEKVRLLGIDTPEKTNNKKLKKDAIRSNKDKVIIEALGKLSSDYADSLLLNRFVKLVQDSSNSDKDKYGRLLRYAYFESGELYNLKVIRDGYAYAFTQYPFLYMEEFRNAERVARENRNGLWGDINFIDLK